MVKRNLLGRIFTLCLVYVPNINQDTFFEGFIFALPSSENLSTEGDVKLTLNFPVHISDSRSEEFYSSGPFLTRNTTQPGVLADQALSSLKFYLFYSHNNLLITPLYCISLSGSSQDSLTQTYRGQMTWSVSLSALTTQRDCQVSQRHKKYEPNDFLFNLFLALEVENSKNQLCFHNGTSPSSSLYGIYNVLKRELTEKTSGIERGQNAECRFCISEIKNLEVYKNAGAKKMLYELLFLGCLLHALVLEKIVCVLHQCRQKYSKTENKRHAVTVCKVRSERENHIVIGTRKQTGKIYYFLRTHIREARVQLKAQHLKGESEGTKSSRGADPEKPTVKLYQALKDRFLPKLTNLICYFLYFKPLADTLKEADSTVLKTEKGDFSSHRDMPLLNTEFRTFVALLTAMLESVLAKVFCIASVKIRQRQLLLDDFHILIRRHSDLIMLKFVILFSSKREKACGHLKWKFSKEKLIEGVRNKWTEIVLYKLLEQSQLSRQTWNSYSLLPILFALLGKQFVQKVRMNKLKPCLNANKLIYETMLCLKGILLAIQSASNPLYLRTFQLLKLIISIHKLCEFDVQVKTRSGHKFILRWSNATESTG